LILEEKEVAYESTDKSEWPGDFFHARNIHKDKKAGASIVPLGELETFSSTVSWDGIRWCASVACASHGEYSNLSYEELALFRQELI